MIFPAKNIDDVLFLDIETVPVRPAYFDLSDEGKMLWDLKSQSLTKYLSNKSLGDSPEQIYAQRAGIYAEFAKVICISMAYLKKGKVFTLRMKSIYGHDEKEILTQFRDLLDEHFDNAKKHKICGHNIKEFDIPFLCRRMLSHQVSFPNLLQIQGRKPWQVDHLVDTMQLWKFGDYKNYTSLRLLAYTLGIPSPKQDIDGSEVARVYYEDEDLSRIVEYCENDVTTVAKVLLEFSGLSKKELIIDKA